jgi:lysophospholipase L1-like esterase
MGNGEHILLNVPLDSIKCDFMGAFNSIPDAYILDSIEMTSIHQAIADYNSIIVQKAIQYNLALLDMNQYFNTVVSGIKWNGADINADFISGGFFSLDGYHPNQIGYSLIANEFIRAINQKYGASIPPVNCRECDGIRFP